ncbi:acyltransferase [Bradyrhizobium sp. CB82]|uniref:acyltransferase family protein n=1 Tax=Bradyrhizobium sp. CB82 TaxID=3039159 RepID=UPI0024B21B04|nr:acyltransferase [Bradyrhizobium sp. CB82]WFU44023.1 acyltransferase [Bradyrhizobium sp. CB82]
MTCSPFTLDASKNDTSLALDALRAIAAQMVCVGHGISFFMPGLRQSGLPLPQNVGVLLFFVLSGFLITYTLIEKSRDPRYTFLQFFIDRTARIYSALVPCLLIVALVDTATIRLIGDRFIEGNRSPGIFLANLLMLESYRGPLDYLSALQWPIFGSASQLWTLVIEWHIYLFVGALFFIGATPTRAALLIPIAIIFGQIPIHYLFGALQEDNGIGRSLFALWLGGAYSFVVVSFGALKGRTIGAVLAVASMVAYVATTPAYLEYRPRGYPYLVIFVLAVVVATQGGRIVVSPWPAKIIRFFANYSFTLYLVHHTLMAPAFLLWKDAGWLVFIPTVVGANIVSAIVANYTEMRHKQLAQFLRRGISRVESYVRGDRDVTSSMPSERSSD